MPPSSCPDENELISWALGQGASGRIGELAAHLGACQRCREAVGLVARQAAPNDDTAPVPLRLGELPGRSGALAIGARLLDKYEVVEVLGEGGMGVVIKARHLKLNAHVALKLIRPGLAAEVDLVSRFSREARAASRLKSPHANRVLDLEHLPDGQPMMVMEYLEGETLEARRCRSPRPTELQVAQWVKQALHALREAHQLGIVHRDLKPANLFLRRESQTLVVLDFGAAKSVNPDIEVGLAQTTVGGVVGSPSFMAPEQLTPGAVVDARADVWALGCTMHLLLADELPFRGTDLVDLAWRVRNQAPAPLPGSVSAPMQACIARCLQRDPAGRWPSAEALEAALDQVIASQVDGSVGGVRRRPVRAALLAGSIAAALIGVGAVVAGAGRSPPAPAPKPALLPVEPAAAVVDEVPRAPDAAPTDRTAVAGVARRVRASTPESSVGSVRDAGFDDVFGKRQ